MSHRSRLYGAIATVVASLFLNLYSDIWNHTPIPRVIGGALFRAEQIRAKAAFGAMLASSDPAQSVSIPVIGVRARDISDSYGSPRSGERSHEGIDIFARRGAVIRSATPGIVLRIGTNTLGGNIIFILGPGGERYYYAHLDSYDPYLTTGQMIGTTTVLGTVGTTGNATGTPPHLHFGIYGRNGALNPFSRLQD